MDDVRDRIAKHLASPQWALMRRSPNVIDERGAVTDAPATFDERFPRQTFQIDYDPKNPPLRDPPLPPATRLGVEAGAVDLDLKRR